METIAYTCLAALAFIGITFGLIAWWDVRTDKDLKGRDEIKYPQSWDNDDWFGM